MVSRPFDWSPYSIKQGIYFSTERVVSFRRETAIQKLEWKDGWPYVVGGKEGALEVEAPAINEKVLLQPTIQSMNLKNQR
ncbi:hypothetical protein ACEQPO_16085 [Bacillus sp. SL00103]